MQNRKKAYLTPEAREYVLAAKYRLRAILKDAGWSHAEFAARTGIPPSTISHWLNLSRPDFMTLGDAAIVSMALGVAIKDLLPEATWPNHLKKRHAVMSFFLELPLSHARWLMFVYKGAMKVFAK